jgi:hypothetical protein
LFFDENECNRLKGYSADIKANLGNCHMMGCILRQYDFDVENTPLVLL